MSNIPKCHRFRSLWLCSPFWTLFHHFLPLTILPRYAEPAAKNFMIILAPRPLQTPLHLFPTFFTPTQSQVAPQDSAKTSAPLGTPHWPVQGQFRSFPHPPQPPVVATPHSSHWTANQMLTCFSPWLGPKHLWERGYFLFRIKLIVPRRLLGKE